MVDQTETSEVLLKPFQEFEYIKSMHKNHISKAMQVKKNNEIYILKILTANSEGIKDIKSLSHCNLVSYKEIIPIQENEAAILQEYIPGISLNDILNDYKERNKKIPEVNINKWIDEILSALEYIHSKGIIHGRMNLNNVIIRTEDQSAKLSDFATNWILTKCGTECAEYKVGVYSAPEFFEGKTLPSSDIWAFGCIVYELCTFQPFVKSTSIMQMLNSFGKQQSIKLEGYSDKITTKVDSMLQVDPDKRPTAVQLLKLELYRKPPISMEQDEAYKRALKCMEAIENTEGVQEVLKMLMKIKDSCGENSCNSNVYWKMGSLQLQLGQYGEALLALERALKMHESSFSIKTEELGLLLIDIAAAQNSLNNFSSCYESLTKAIKIFEDLESKKLGFAYAKLADYYIDQSNSENSDEYLEKALKAAKEYGEAYVYKTLGKLRLFHNKQDEAIIQFTKARDLYLSAKSLFVEKAEVEGGLGEAYNLKGDKTKSMELFNEAIATMSSGNVRNANLGKIFEKLQEISAKEENWVQFFDYLKKAIEVYTDTKSWGSLLSCYCGAAELLDNSSEASNKEKVVEYATLAIDLQSKFSELNKYEKPLFNTILIKAFVMVGQFNTDIGSWEKALQYFDDALKLIDGVVDKLTLQILYESLANGYYKAKAYDKCTDFIQKAIVFAKEKDEEPDLYILSGKIYGKLRSWSQALKAFETAVALFECRRIENESRAYAMLNLAVVQSNLGDVDKSIDSAKLAVGLYERLRPDSIPLADAYKTLAMTYRTKDNHQEQIRIIIGALDLYKTHRKRTHKQVASCYVSLAIAFGNLGNSYKKQEFAKKAVRLLERYNKRETNALAFAYVTLGTSFGVLEDWVKQAKYAKKAIAIHEKFSVGSLNHGYACYCLGIAIANQKMFEDGIKQLEKAQSIYEEFKEVTCNDYGDICNCLGIAYENKGKHKLSKEYYEKAYLVKKNVLGDEHEDVKNIKSKLTLKK